MSDYDIQLEEKNDELKLIKRILYEARIEREALIKEREQIVEVSGKLRKELDDLKINYANIEYYLLKAVDSTKLKKSKRASSPPLEKKVSRNTPWWHAFNAFIDKESKTKPPASASAPPAPAPALSAPPSHTETTHFDYEEYCKDCFNDFTCEECKKTIEEAKALGLFVTLSKGIRYK